MIVVTGGAGFIGSSVITRLNSSGVFNIVAVDEIRKLNTQKKKNLKSLKYQELLEKEEFLRRFKKGLLPEVKTVIHMGACSSTTEKDHKYLMNTNYEYSRRLCSICMERNAQFIYASSAATYGDGSKGFSDDHKRLEEYKPLNPYGLSKHKFDLWAKEEGLLNKITGLKYFNVYGPNEYHKGTMRSFIIKAYEQIKSWGKVRLFKSDRDDYEHGEQKRDFIYIKDAVDMTLAFLKNKKAKGIYNIGTSRPETWNCLAALVFKAMGREVNIEYIEMPEDIKEKYQYYTKADMDKFKAAGFEFCPAALQEGIDDYVQNYLPCSRRLGEIKKY